MLIERCDLPLRNERTIAPHRHAETEWHFAVAGGCCFDIGDGAVEFAAGDLLAIPPRALHRVRIRRPGEWLLQIILRTRSEGRDDDALLDAFQRQAGRRGAVRVGQRRHAFFVGIAHDLRASDPFRRRSAHLRFTALICELAAGIERDGHPAVAAALKLMRENLDARLTLAAIAAAAGCSRSLIARRFRAEVGEPPLAHHLGMRLDRAADLLRQDGRHVHEAATASGFDDPYYFSRCFAKRFARPPSRWR
jgi:AraC-like DNA-binding protein